MTMTPQEVNAATKAIEHLIKGYSADRLLVGEDVYGDYIAQQKRSKSLPKLTYIEFTDIISVQLIEYFTRFVVKPDTPLGVTKL